MKAVFEVKTIEADWAPPFRKNISNEEYSAGMNEGFDRIVGNGNNEAVFTVLDINANRAKIRFSSLFTIKNPGENDGNDKTLAIEKGETKTIAYLWGEKGITKSITYKGSPSAFETRAMEAAEEKEEPKQESQETAEPEEKEETYEPEPAEAAATETSPEEPKEIMKENPEVPNIQNFF